MERPRTKLARKILKRTKQKALVYPNSEYVGVVTKTVRYIIGERDTYINGTEQKTQKQTHKCSQLIFFFFTKVQKQFGKKAKCKRYLLEKR